MKKQRNWKPQIVPLVFLLLICAMLFTSCFDGDGTPTEPPTPHDSAPTGNESGSSEGSDTGNNQTEPHVHKWSDWTVTTEPTCTKEGEESRTCACGETETQPVASMGHSYNSTVTAPTCTAKGYTTYTCSCGDAYVDDYVDAIEHTYSSTITAPTCTTRGYTTYTCSCGDSYNDNYVDAKGHNYSSKEIAPTCTTRGYTTYTCSCGDSYNDNYVDAKGHHFSKWRTIKNATCTENGEQERECRCGEKETQSIDTIDCIESVWIVVTEATKTADGVLKKSCIMCGKTFREVVMGAGSQGLWYELNPDNKSYSVASFGTCYDKEVVIPKVYYGLPVTSIGDYAFRNFRDGITSITIPDTVTNIGSNLFATTNTPFDIYLPKSVVSIDDDAFDSCYSIRKLYFAGTITDWLNIEFNGAWSNPLCSGADLYINGELVTKIDIPDTVTSIPDYAFCGSSIKEINIPNSVTSIGYYAFYYCKSLTSVTIPNSVISIDCGAFKDCSSLVSVMIGDSVKQIESRAFDGCNSLIEICNKSSLNIIVGMAGDGTLGNVGLYAKYIITEENQSYLKYVGDYIFYDDGTDILLVKYFGDDAEITLPEYDGGKEYEIYQYAFYNNDHVTRIIIPNFVTSIGSDSFRGCTVLTDIIIPDSVISVGNAFVGCTSLKYNEYDNAYYLGNSINPYQVLIDAKNTNITSCEIHSDTKVIAPSAFSSCSKLKSIIIPDSVINIGEKVFAGCSSLESLTLPFVGDSANNHVPFGYLFGTEKYTGSTCVNQYYYYLTKYYDYYIPTSLKTVTITGGSISHYAFANCTMLENIILGNSVTSIGLRAFYQCSSLVNLTIGNSVEYIDSYAFNGCPLSYNEYNNVYYLGNDENPYLVLIRAKDKNIVSVVIPNETKIVYEDAFGVCYSLVSLTIGDAVERIGLRAFMNCYSLIEICNKSSLDIIVGSEAYGRVGYYAEHVITEENQSYLKYVGDYIFYDDGTDILLVKYFGDDAEITLPEYDGGKEYEIYQYAFYRNNNLTDIVIPDTVTDIGSYSFYNCTSLTKLVIPKSVRYISSWHVFEGCASLTIYCEVESKPTNWDKRWNEGRPVVWGYVNADI